jgi:flagellar assembly protein FliH
VQPVIQDAVAERHAERLQPGAKDREQEKTEAYREGLEAGREEARQAGFEQGLQQGLAEGRDRGVSEVQRDTDAMRATMVQQMELLEHWAKSLKAQTAQHLAQRLEAVEDDMVALCHVAISRLLGAHALTPRIITEGVRRSVSECCGDSLEGLLSVDVHPADLELLQMDSDVANWLATKQGTGVVWRADGQVALGGCVVRSTSGNLDARLETQLTALTKALLQHRSEGPTA